MRPPAEFDHFADAYRALHARNIRFSGEEPDYFASYKVDDVAKALRIAGAATSKLSILDFGGGIGASVPHFRRVFADAHVLCVDMSAESLSTAARDYPGMASYIAFDGRSLPTATSSIDLVFTACVFHHIVHCEHSDRLAELLRVLKPGGWLFVFEHNPYNPLTRHAVATCPFDRNAHLIRGGILRRRVCSAGFADVRLRFRIVFPRALARLRFLEPFLAAVPLGAQYYVAARKP
jgi:SAM-dependent methyltransferase